MSTFLLTPLTSLYRSNARLSANNNKHEPYPIEASTEQALAQATQIDVLPDGTLHLERYPTAYGYIIDFSDVVQEVNVSDVCDELTTYAHQIYSIRSSSSHISKDFIGKIINLVCKNQIFKFLIEIAISYQPLPVTSVTAISKALNPIISGYCPIKRLVLSRTNINLSGCKHIIESLRGNIFLEELILTGNDGNDELIASYVAITGFDLSKIKIFNIGSNNLTPSGIHTLAKSITSNIYLKELDLHNNELGDEGADILLGAIRENSILTSLNLSNTNIVSCMWAEQLRVITSLSVLNLSNNRINDDGFVLLMEALERTFCIREIDLSNNLMSGKKCVIIGKLLQQNAGLMLFNLSSANFVSEVWEAIGVGLQHNNTLLRLNLTNCGLTDETATLISHCFEENEICDINMNYNNISDILRLNARSSSSMYKELNSGASGISLKNSFIWRRQKLQEIQHAKDALKVLHKLGTLEDHHDDASNTIGTSTYLMDAYNNEEEYNDDKSLSTALVTVANIDPSAKKAKDNRARRQQVDANALVYSQGKKVLSVSYGYFNNGIGSIEVTDSTNYVQAKELIKVLIEQYLASNNAEVISNLIENFTILDYEGHPVLGVGMKLRTIWSEAALGDQHVTVRPADWRSILDSENDYEEDDNASAEQLVDHVDDASSLESPSVGW